MKTPIKILLIILFAGASAKAQTQFMGWGASFINYKVNDKFGLYFDGQYRSTDRLQQLNQLLLRPGVNFYLSPAFTFTSGYAMIPQQRISNGVTGYLPEHRIWEQLVFTHKVKAVRATVSHRARLEHRFIPRHHAEGNSLVKDGHRTAGRLRYFTRGVVPLGNASDKGMFAAIQNEIFFHTADGGSFDQNRAYIAAGYRMSRQLDLEMGYMNQYIAGAGGASTNNHILQVATYIRL
ncbi:MAG TPA: DUF2490 domain-containing protein [Puia sp.]|uniref:DUF2490 domain-containing protein n=1 Tax=Puia sp. TaxID=2045100 RepID=UPI002C3962EE|nr:DUF2490 domain-containing protein [Puia sp.]HVU97566.1 DUF2490 domain-containing protein [Puia sp.]